MLRHAAALSPAAPFIPRLLGGCAALLPRALQQAPLLSRVPRDHLDSTGLMAHRRGLARLAAYFPESSEPTPDAGHATAWREPWLQLLTRLHSCGHFAADQHVTPQNLEQDRGAVKRAVLSFARQRADLLPLLSRRHLKALVTAGVPQDQIDRKIKNAYRRLDASILLGEDLAPGDGGPADLQDILRMVLALAGSDEAPGRLASAAAALLPDLLAAWDAAGDGKVELSEKAKNIERLRRGAE